MNRGSELHQNLRVDLGLASMRPRFMNRGSARPLTCTGRDRPCFNEAPIHESGKFPRALRRCLSQMSFNEAPIHESGKCVRSLRAVESRHLASMRPRFMNRGSLDGA